jgi:DNA anti-recombination protein RmuC
MGAENDSLVLGAIQKLSENMEARFLTMDRRFEKVDLRFQEMDQRFQEMDQRFEKMVLQFQEIGRRFESVDLRFQEMDQRIADAIEEMESHLKAELKRMIDDRVNQLDIPLRFYKQAIRDQQNRQHREQPYSRQVVIPRSISSYTVQEIPAEPWDPPGARL